MENECLQTLKELKQSIDVLLEGFYDVKKEREVYQKKRLIFLSLLVC